MKKVELILIDLQEVISDYDHQLAWHHQINLVRILFTATDPSTAQSSHGIQCARLIVKSSHYSLDERIDYIDRGWN